MQQEECEHANTYFGVVNIRYKNQIIGAVDVWRCAKCKKMFCEEKQLGILDISSEIGMPTIGADQRWAVLVCGLKRFRDRWALVGLGRDGEFVHKCVDDKDVIIKVADYKVQGDDRHWTFMVDESVNKEVEID